MKKTIGAFLVLLAILNSCGTKDSKPSMVKLIPVAKSNGEFQYINQDGKIVINPQFLDATIFREGLALVKTSTNEPMWGYISEDGKYVISPQFLRATGFSQEIAWVVVENAAPVAIDKKGEQKFSLPDAEAVHSFEEGLAGFSQIDEEWKTLWGFVDKTGKIAISPQFSALRHFSEGLCAVRNNEGKWGYIDRSGQIIINPQFDEAGDFLNGNAVVKSGNGFGVIGKNGRFIINPQFSRIVIDGNSFLVEQNGRYGWCDKDGKFNINPQFNGAFPFSGQKFAPVKSGEKWGYIDRSGKITVNPQFDKAFPFLGDMALIEQGRKFGFIGFDGRFKINPQFEEASYDYLLHISGSKLQQYNSVATDFFNVEKILSLMDFETPLGVSLGSTFAEVINTLEVSQSFLNRFGIEHQVIRRKSISKDAIINFSLVGNAFHPARVQKDSGRNTFIDTEYRFEGQRKIEGLFINLILTGKGLGKGDLLVSSIKDKVRSDNYHIVERRQNDKGDGVVFSNGIQDIIISNTNSSVNIFIFSSDLASSGYTLGITPEGSLQVNKRVESVLSGLYDNWSVYLEAGKNYQIDMMSNDFDTIITLFDSNENRISKDDDGGSGTNSRLRFRPTASSIYFIRAESYRSSRSGRYSIQIQER